MLLRNVTSAAMVAALSCFTGAQADELDGSRPVLCAIMSAVECVDGAGCENKHPTMDLDLPQFLRIDFASKKIITVRTGGSLRTAAISSVSSHQRALILQGVQDEMGWTISIDKSSGGMSATVADRDMVFVVFGACMAEK